MTASFEENHKKPDHFRSGYLSLNLRTRRVILDGFALSHEWHTALCAVIRNMSASTSR